MKKFLLKWALPKVIELAIEALQSLAKKTDNTVDDIAVAMFAENQDKIIAEIKANL